MGLLPTTIASYSAPQVKQVLEFKGLNRQPMIEDGEMREMKNLCASEYPSLYQRPMRGVIDARYIRPVKILRSKSKLCVLDNTAENTYKFYIDGELIQTFNAASPPTMIVINKWIAFFPARKVYNIESGTFTDIARQIKIYPSGGTAPETIDGVTAGESGVASTASLKTYAYPATTKVNVYTEGADIYDRILIYGGKDSLSSTYGIFNTLEKGDVVKIKGFTTQPLNDGVEAKILDISENKNCLYFPSGTFQLADQYDEDGNEIVSIHTSTNKGWGKFYVEAGNLSFEKAVPNLDYVIEKDNRIWGLSNEDNTIYACKLGDPTNWFYYQNETVDSYAVEVGTDGNWTGIGTYSSYLLFFKENWMTRLTGAYPAQYMTTNIECHGVQEGCAGSVATINGTCYYKSRVGVMAYGGSFPVCVSQALHNTFYSDAHAGTDRDQYYISMMDKEGTYHFFVFDETAGVWFEQDNTHAADFCFCYNVLCYIDADTNTIMSISPREDLIPLTTAGDFDVTVDSMVKNDDEDFYRVYIEEMLDENKTDKAKVPHIISINGIYFQVIEDGEKNHYAYYDRFKDQYYVKLYPNRPKTNYTDILQWNAIYAANVERDEIEWYAVLGEFHEFTENRKIYSKLQLRFKLAEGADALVEISTDGSAWRPVGNFHRSSKRTVNLPILPSRCDNFRVKISGKGYCRIDSLVREYREGSMTANDY